MVDLFSLNELDRTVYELIRLELVALHLLPDITAYNSPNDYFQAKVTLSQSLKNQGKEMVEVFGVGSAASRDEKTYSKIVIQRKAVTGGSLGGDGLHYYEEYYDANSNKKFRKMAYPDSTKNVRYEIRCIAGSRASEVVITNMLYRILSQKKYVNTFDGYDEFGTKKFLINYDGDIDVTVAGSEFVERLFTFVLPEIFVNEAVILSGNIVPLTSINWCVKLVGSQDEFIQANVKGEDCGNVVSGSVPPPNGSFNSAFSNSFL